MFITSSIVATGKPAEYLPADPETFTHDADGNLTQDGKWSYTWDAENRLIQMETRREANDAGAEYLRLTFAYDSQGRRYRKTVLVLGQGAPIVRVDSLFIYDGWNLIATLRSQVSGLSPQQSYLWGLDLSGAMQGAGGVGGLLAVTDHTTGSTFYPSFDGNGSVMGYYAADTGARVAEFEYGPFGESIRATGSKAGEFNFRFSTKYLDQEILMYYYGFRYYDPGTGRWPSRDPLRERGGFNLYAFVKNDPIRNYDLLGLQGKKCGSCKTTGKGQFSKKSNPWKNLLSRGGGQPGLDNIDMKCKCSGEKKCTNRGKCTTEKCTKEVMSDSYVLNTDDVINGVLEDIYGMDHLLNAIANGTLYKLQQEAGNAISNAINQSIADSEADFKKKCSEYDCNK